MATYYSTEYTAAHVTEPSTMLDVTLNHGRLRRSYAVYTLPAATEFAEADVVYMMKLPAGARISSAHFVATDDLTSGICKIGWAANGTDAADDDGIFAVASCDFGNANIDATMSRALAGWNKKFAAETDITMTITEASNASTGNSFYLEIYYTLD